MRYLHARPQQLTAKRKSKTVLENRQQNVNQAKRSAFKLRAGIYT